MAANTMFCQGLFQIFSSLIFISSISYNNNNYYGEFDLLKKKKDDLLKGKDKIK